MSETAAEMPEIEQPETSDADVDSAAPAPSKRKSKQAEPEYHFNVGDVVVVRRDFHSQYFRGMTGIIEGEAEKGGTAQKLWPVKIDVTPYRLYVAGKYIQLKEEADREAAEAAKNRPVTSDAAATNGARSGKQSFLSRIIPWKK